jgi:hypothetical protein
MLSNNFALIFRRRFHGFNALMQLGIKCLTDCLNRLNPCRSKGVLETRSRSPYALGNNFGRVAYLGGFGCAL